MPIQAGIRNSNLYASVLGINFDFLIGDLVVMETTSLFVVHVTRHLLPHNGTGNSSMPS
jgi:hypothetical protein